MSHASLIDELESAVKTGTPENRLNTLRRITDLFLRDADRLNDAQIKVFDDVLCRLTAKIEKTARIELARRLAPVDAAPIEMVRRLARDEIDVARPVLAESKRLSDGDLVEIVQTKSQAHLLAISGRTALEEAVTDALLDRGNREVVTTLAGNAGAHFSTFGFESLVKKSETDDDLVEIVGLRKDIPLVCLRDLLQLASDAVRQKLLALVPPQRRHEINELIAKVTETVGSAAAARDFSRAEASVRALEEAGALNEVALLGILLKGRHDELIVALARLCAAPVRTIAELLTGHRNDAVLIPCKAADLSWSTVERILRHRPGRSVSDSIIALARTDYAKLSRATAQRTLRFMQVRETVS